MSSPVVGVGVSGMYQILKLEFVGDLAVCSLTVECDQHCLVLGALLFVTPWRIWRLTRIKMLLYPSGMTH